MSRVKGKGFIGNCVRAVIIAQLLIFGVILNSIYTPKEPVGKETRPYTATGVSEAPPAPSTITTLMQAVRPLHPPLPPPEPPKPQHTGGRPDLSVGATSGPAALPPPPHPQDYSASFDNTPHQHHPIRIDPAAAAAAAAAAARGARVAQLHAALHPHDPPPPPPPPPRPPSPPPGAGTAAGTAAGAALQDLSKEAICGQWPQACRCERLDPKVVVYNRIPKAGSGSMNVFLGEAEQRTQAFDFCRSRLYHDRLLKGRQQAEPYALNPITASACKQKSGFKRAVLSRHVFFLNASEHQPRGGGGGASSRGGAGSTAKRQYRPEDMSYMNVIRDPIGRCVSRFYYERDAKGTFGHDATLDECMAPAGKCAFEAWREQESATLPGRWSRIKQFREECSSNYLSRWFCGMNDLCHRDVRARAVLEQAKRVMATGYSFVGLTSELKTSFRLAQRLYPKYFDNDTIPLDICNKCKMPPPPPPPEEHPEEQEEAAATGAELQVNVSAATAPTAAVVSVGARDVRLPGLSPPPAGPPPLPPAPLPSSANWQRLSSLNTLDLELYAFAEALFWIKVEACGLGSPGKDSSPGAVLGPQKNKDTPPAPQRI